MVFNFKNKVFAFIFALLGAISIATSFNSQVVQADGGSWEGTGNYHDATWKSQDGSVWTNVHHDISVPMGATNEQIINQIGLPTVTSADGEKANVTYEFNWNDGKGKPTQIQFYYQFNGGQKRIGANTGIQRQPVQPSISAKDGKTSISTPVGHPVDILSLVSTSSNNGNETPKLSIYNDGGLNWNEPGLYTVQVESKDSYNYPAYLTFTVHVTGNDDNNTDKPVNPGTPGEGQGKITTRYVDQNGNKIHADNVEIGYQGTHYQTAPIGKVGYKLIDTKGQEKGTITNGGDVTVTYIYEKKSSNTNNDSNNTNNDSNNTNNDSNNTNNDSNNGNFSKSHQYLTVFRDNINLFYINGSDVSIVKDRSLANYSSWQSDKKIIINGIIYYRVATNEWVKSSDVYLYKPLNTVLKAFNINDRFVPLVKSDGTKVMNRALSNGSSWYTDKEVMINGINSYRVATNEFVASNYANLK